MIAYREPRGFVAEGQIIADDHLAVGDFVAVVVELDDDERSAAEMVKHALHARIGRPAVLVVRPGVVGEDEVSNFHGSSTIAA